jgi:hypothetical protein
MAIARWDAAIVAHKDRSQDLKMAVDIVKRNEISEAEIFQKITVPGVGSRALQ